MTSKRNKMKLLLSPNDYELYLLMKRWYNNKQQADMDKCILFYLDHYLFDDGNVLLLFKHILETYDFQTAIDVTFVGFDDDVKKIKPDEYGSCRLDGSCED